MAREQDRLRQEAKVMVRERDEAKLLVVESETDYEWKDKYIDHFVFLLEPHLTILPVEVIDEIHRIPKKIRVSITPTDCWALKAYEAGVGEVADAADAWSFYLLSL